MGKTCVHYNVLPLSFVCTLVSENCSHNYMSTSRKSSKGKTVIRIMINLKKAFDGICHNTLLKKLYAYGIRGKVFNWFKSYFTNSTQHVRYGNSKSETKTYGVPQGSTRDHCYLFICQYFFPSLGFTSFYFICQWYYVMNSGT